MTATRPPGPALLVSEHGAKIAASRLGITVHKYQEHLANDERHCGRCRRWKPIASFSPQKNRSTGAHGYCRACNQKDADARRVPSDKQRLRAAAPELMDALEELLAATRGHPGQAGVSYCRTCSAIVLARAAVAAARGEEQGDGS